MPDISMCLDRQCPSRGQCHRYVCRPGDYQWYAEFARGSAERCASFEPRWPTDRTGTEADAGNRST